MMTIEQMGDLGIDAQREPSRRHGLFVVAMLLTFVVPQWASAEAQSPVTSTGPRIALPNHQVLPLAATRDLARLSKATAQTRKACGVSINASVNWEAVPKDYDEGYVLGAYCEAALHAVAEQCSDSAMRAFVVNKVSHIDCSFSKRVQRITLRKGVLDFQANLEQGHHKQYVKTFLSRMLALAASVQ